MTDFAKKVEDKQKKIDEFVVFSYINYGFKSIATTQISIRSLNSLLEFLIKMEDYENSSIVRDELKYRKVILSDLDIFFDVFDYIKDKLDKEVKNGL